MRKAVLLTTMLVAIGGVALAAQAGQDSAPVKSGVELSTQEGAPGKDADHLNAPRNDRPHESGERSRREHREVHEDEEEDDRD